MVDSYMFSVCTQCIKIYCEALRIFDYIRDFDVYLKPQITEQTLRVQPAPCAVCALPLSSAQHSLSVPNQYVHEAQNPHDQPVGLESRHSMLVLAITIGNIKSHPSQRTIHFTNIEKPET